ncbi:ribbon-helix-helix protein, CopG family [Nostocoides veronense]|uniref:Ribbon-helix-helix protein CopG domain-containing protein n=1 Tax=Nostocoides veronense TaxID=330836 RepID=A0ABN2LZ87_9MICO
MDGDLHARITILARLTGVSVTEAIREAIEKHVAALAALFGGEATPTADTRRPARKS